MSEPPGRAEVDFPLRYAKCPHCDGLLGFSVAIDVSPWDNLTRLPLALPRMPTTEAGKTYCVPCHEVPAVPHECPNCPQCGTGYCGHHAFGTEAKEVRNG